MSDQNRIDNLENAPNRTFNYNDFKTLFAEDLQYLSTVGGGGSGARFHAFRNATLNVSSLTNIVWDAVIEDTESAYNDSNGIYTIPETGVYLFEISVTTVADQPAEFWAELVQAGVGFNPGMKLEVTGTNHYRQSWTRYLTQNTTIGFHAGASASINIGSFRSEIRAIKIA